MNTLITASALTLRWTRRIESEVARQDPDVLCSEKKYWMTFRRPGRGSNLAYLQPQATKIRVFIRLSPAANPALRRTPSSSNWADAYPSVFLVEGEMDVERAAQFIVRS